MVWLLIGCVTEQDVPPALPAEVELAPIRSCDSPVEGFARFELEPVVHTPEIDRDTGPCPFVRGGLVAQDLDADGDTDVLVHDVTGFPTLLENIDGALSERAVDLDARRDVYATSAVDLDGDGLGEVVVVGPDLVLISWNLGDLQFSDWDIVLDEDTFPCSCSVSMAWGDADGDGDLDLALPGADYAEAEDVPLGEEDSWVGTPDRLFLNEGGVFTLAGEFSPLEGDAISLVHAFTDRDLDGDLDWLAGTDRAQSGQLPPMAFHRNDGGGVFEDDAAEIGADTRVAAMGLAVSDLNADGLLDYCMSDAASALSCLMSDGTGGYYEGGPAIGLDLDLGAYPYTPDNWETRNDDQSRTWFSWALVLDDLDNDGFADMAATGGPPPEQGNPFYSNMDRFQPNAIWQGSAEGFVERSVETGVGDASGHFDYAMVSADLRGDGYRELLVSSQLEPLAVWDNPCGDEGWLEVEVVGVDDNVQAYGARVEVVSGGRSQLREVHNLALVSQATPSLHFGLGEHEVEALIVTFPDGSVVEAGAFEGSRSVRVRHPGL